MTKRKSKDDTTKPDDKKPGAGKDAFKDTAAKVSAGEPGKKTRVRRTREQIQADKNALSDMGFEVIAQFMKMMSDLVTKKCEVKPFELVTFEPLAKQYSMITNHFFPNAKPIWFVVASAGVTSGMIINTHLKMIQEYNAKHPKPDGKKSNISPRKERDGQEFPTEKEVKPIVL